MTTLGIMEALTNGARSPFHRAAVFLLCGLAGLFDRTDVMRRWYDVSPSRRVATVRWDVIAADADADAGPIPMSTGERAVLLLAASLADGYRVDLGYVLPFIDTTHAGNLIAAVHMLCQPDQVDPRALAHAAMTGQDDDR